MRRKVQRIFGSLEDSGVMSHHSEDVRQYLLSPTGRRSRLIAQLLSSRQLRYQPQTKIDEYTLTNGRRDQWIASFLLLSYKIRHRGYIHHKAALCVLSLWHKLGRLLVYQLSLIHI